MTTAAADAAITGATLTVGTKTGKYSDTVAANIVMTQDTGCVPVGTPVNYTYSLGRFPTPQQIIYPRWDADSNLPIYWSQVTGATAYVLERSANSGSTYATTVYTGTATFRADSVAPAPTYRYRVMARNADSNSLYIAATYDVNAYLSRCYKGGNTSDANWAQWLSLGRPDCWCAASTAQEPNGSGYQCDGDADGSTEVTGVNYRVYTKDLTILSNNYKKKAADVTNDPNVTLTGKFKIHSGCGDFDHKAEVTGVNYRIYTKDLTILSNNYKKKSSSTAAGTQYLPGNCPR
jgi:hypothetical protein